MARNSSEPEKFKIAPRHSKTDMFLRKTSTTYLSTMYTFLYCAIPGPKGEGD